MNVSFGNESLYSVTSKISSNEAKAKNLEEKLKSKSASDEDLLEACKSFEAYMLEQVFKSMEKTIPKDEDKNPYLEQFGDILHEEYAKSAVQGEGIGIAKTLYEAMKRNM